MKVKRILLHILWISTAVALIAAGFGCVFNGNEVMTLMADWIGVLVLVSGLTQIAIYGLIRDTVFGDRGLLMKGIFSCIVGIFIMCKSFIAADVLRVLISMMILFDGITLLGLALNVRHEKIWGQGWLWLLGILEIALGILGFIRPDLINVALGVIVGGSLIYEGVVQVYTWIVAMKFLSH